MKNNVIIKNANIFPMDSDEIENGTIVIKNGKIDDVFEGKYLGDISDFVVYDIMGRMIFPGFVDAHTHVGMWEDGLGFEGDDGNEDTDPATPQLRAIDAINPFDRCFRDLFEAGITTVVTGPGSANPIGGQLCAVKTQGKSMEDMIVKAPIAMKMALGENPKTVYNSKNQSPVTRMATASIIREQLYTALRYLKDKEMADKDEDTNEPDYDAKCEALIPVVEGKLPVHFHAHRADDIFTAKRIADEFSLKYVIVHGTGGHKAAELMGESGMKVLCGPLLTDRAKPEMKDLSLEGPSILKKAGVDISIITDHPVIPGQYLTLCAGLAAREGLDEMEAIRAITINPARICNIDDRVGSITKGKDADFIVFDEFPLVLTAKPVVVFANGEIKYGSL